VPFFLSKIREVVVSARDQFNLKVA
jgi:hypothetical protein